MSLSAPSLKLILLCVATCSLLTLNAQSDIKIGNIKANHVDKQKRKQGEWIFFDNEGFIRMSCVYKDDHCISPIIFYENTDTAFVKLPVKDSIESFIFYKNGKKYFGDFIHTSDSTSRIEVDPDQALTDSMVADIEKYQAVTIRPVYFFAQQKMRNFLSAAYSSSRFVFNKPLNILLTISSSGFVTNVEFIQDKSSLSADEETELYRIYSKMPRWQPFFVGNKTRAVKMQLTNNATLSIISF
jgi:hypothetical protein